MGAERFEAEAGRNSMSGIGISEEHGSKRGVKTKLIAVVLLFLGSMDSMLSWRGGFEVSDTTILLFAGGLALYAFGAIRGLAEA